VPGVPITYAVGVAMMQRSGVVMGALPRAAAFWLLACLLVSFLFGATAPSPLYSVYQALWEFPASTLTLIYAIYALGALIALLVVGRLSDHVGRRRVTALALVLQLAAMFGFIAADGVEWLLAARIVSGAGTGIATGTISAWLLDLQPADRPRLGSLVASIGILGGLGLGGLATSLLVDYGPDPLHLVYWLLAVVYAIGLASLPFLPDPVSRTPGWLRSLRPEIGIPPRARSAFALSVPSLVAIWAVGGLHAALGPSLAIALLETESRIPGGVLIGALLCGAAAASLAMRSGQPRALLLAGSAVLVVGVAITLIAVVTGSAIALYAGSLVAGLGFGPAFAGVLRTVAPLAPPESRGALLAAVYVVMYLAFSVPTVIAGFLVPYFGLRPTALGYGVAAITLAAVTTVSVARRRHVGQAI
jgi:MFS family permease